MNSLRAVNPPRLLSGQRLKALWHRSRIVGCGQIQRAPGGSRQKPFARGSLPDGPYQFAN